MLENFRANVLNTDTKTKLYNAYLLPHLYYCCAVWHHCGERNLKKLEKINERSLRFVFNDNDSDYMQLLDRVGQPSLFNGRVHILTLVYKSLNGLAPEYITNMFSLKTHSINLRASGTNSLFIIQLCFLEYKYRAKRVQITDICTRLIPPGRVKFKTLASQNFGKRNCRIINLLLDVLVCSIAVYFNSLFVF